MSRTPFPTPAQPPTSASTAPSRVASAASANGPWAQAWQRLSPRQRLGLGLAAAALLVGGVLGGLVRPAWKRLQAAPAQQARLDTEWQTMQALAAQARQLQGHPPRPRDERLNALDTATRRHLGAGASVKLIQDEVTVQLPPTAATALAQWLAEVRVNAQLTPTVVRIHRAGVSAAGGEAAVLWQGSVQFNLGG